MVERKYPLPDDAVYAKPGAYIVRHSREGQFQVFKAGDLYVVSKLLRLEPTGPSGVLFGFIDEKTFGGSNPPDVFYCVESFPRTFPTVKSAIAAIDANSLGESVPDQYMNVSNFLKEDCTVYSR